MTTLGLLGGYVVTVWAAVGTAIVATQFAVNTGNVAMLWSIF